MTACLALLGLAALQTPAPACPPGALCGVVVDGAGLPIQGAEIMVERDGAPVATLTDQTGRFQASDVDGPQTVTVRVAGHNPITLDYDVFLAGKGRVVIEDAPSPEGVDIVVKARRVSLPFSRQVIGKLDLLTDPIANADALLAVAGLPSATNLDNSADVQLRGSAIGLSRVYYNDVPLYEVVRGSSVDQVTRVSSIFNASLVQEIETYPTLPPAYLPNTAAGAVRIIPEVDAAAPSTLFVGLPGVTATTALDLPGGGVQAYASVIDLAGTLALNPKLKRTTLAFTSSAIGAGVSVETSGGARLTGFWVVDAEKGEYPLRLLNLSGRSTNSRSRAYNLVGLETRVGAERLKVDLAATSTSNEFGYLGREVSARNLYLYANADVAGDLPGGLIEYRAGLAGEHIHLKGRGTFVGETPAGQVVERIGYGSAHAFVTIRPATFLTFAMGSRQYLAGDDTPDPTYSAAITLWTSDRRHKIIAGAGTFGAVVPPELISTSPTATARSRQVSLDYEFTGGPVQFKVGGYLKSDRLGGIVTHIDGLDGSLVVQPTARLRLSGSFARSRQRSAGFRGDRDLGHFVRLQSRLSLSRTAGINATFTTRSGAPYTRVLSGATDGVGGFFPVFDERPNGTSLRRFQTLDVNLFERINIFSKKLGPIVFVSITNLLDRRNEARAVYDATFSVEERFLFERRAVSFGLVQSF